MHQVLDDAWTRNPEDAQKTFDLLGTEDEELFWIENTTERFKDGYNHFGRHPERIIAFFDEHMKVSRRPRRAGGTDRRVDDDRGRRAPDFHHCPRHLRRGPGQVRRLEPPSDRLAPGPVPSGGRHDVAALVVDIVMSPDLWSRSNLGVNKPGTDGDKPAFI
jgi:hypothetical protein